MVARILFIAVLLAILPVRVLADTDTRPVVFIPGILGSVLEDESGRVIWGNVQSLRKLRQLEIPEGPRDPSDGLKAVRTLQDIAILGPFKIKQYSTLRADLQKMGYKLGETYFEFPYDWRQSNFTSAQQLKEFIDSAPALRNRRIDIVAHSMGGIIAQIYLKELGGKVAKIVNLGVPFRGSVQTLRLLTEGWGTGANALAGGLTTIRRLALSMPSFYELLPRYPNCCIWGIDGNRQAYDPTFEGNWGRIRWLSRDTTARQRKGLGTALEKVQRLRDVIDAPVPQGTQVYNIVGGSVRTPSRYYVDAKTAKVTRYSSSPGDGTVPEVSAANLQLDRAFVSMSQHQTIFEDKAARTILRRIFVGDTQPDYFSAGTATALTTDGSIVDIESVGLAILPGAVSVEGSVEVTVRIAHLEIGKTHDFAVEAFATLPGREDPVKLTLSRGASSDSLHPQSIYHARLQVGPQPGILIVKVKVDGLASLEDYAAIL